MKVTEKERYINVLLGARSHASFQNYSNLLVLFLLKSEIFRSCLISSCGVCSTESHLRLDNERTLCFRKKVDLNVTT